MMLPCISFQLSENFWCDFNSGDGHFFLHSKFGSFKSMSQVVDRDDFKDENLF
jgi:hypothetical protein